jgi:hypothetical protein
MIAADEADLRLHSRLGRGSSPHSSTGSSTSRHRCPGRCAPHAVAYGQPGHRRRDEISSQDEGTPRGVGACQQRGVMRGPVASAVLLWRAYGFAAQHHPGAHRVVVGLADAHGVHHCPHERNAAAGVLVVDGSRLPAAVVAHDGGDSALPGRCCLDPPADVHQSGWLIEIACSTATIDH